MEAMMDSAAVFLSAPRNLHLDTLALRTPSSGEIVVEVDHSGISTGTEKLFWSGDMPPFPGMGYPLVPGYEATGCVVEAAAGTGFSVGDHVFVPGADCFVGARGLFGGAARRLVTPAGRVLRIDGESGAAGTLYALAATARHTLAGMNTSLPELIVGHGVLGRLIARLTIAAGGPPPTVWDTNADRRTDGSGYDVIAPEEDPRRDYGCIYDASGNVDVLDELISRLTRGGEVVLAGFYPKGVNFAFPPAFMREARLRVAAEWTPEDLVAVRALVESGALSLDGLISHHEKPENAEAAYRTAFEDPGCLKMVIDWKEAA